VHTGAEAGEKANVTAVTALLVALPATIGSGSTARVIGPGPAQKLTAAQLKGALPVGSRVVVDASTWRRIGLVATVAAAVTPPGQPTTRYVVTLGLMDGGWAVLATRPVAAK
jgi:hypothetical protein